MPVPQLYCINTAHPFIQDGGYKAMLILEEEPTHPVVAFMSMYQSYPDDLVWLHEIFVREGHRNRGYAKRLLSHAVSTYRILWPTASGLQASIFLQNQASRSLFANAGFRFLRRQSDSVLVYEHWYSPPPFPR